MSILKNTRLSSDRQTEYQIEYTAMGENDEYRLRRGAYGSWTRWFPTDNILKLLADTGFDLGKNTDPEHATSLLTDFYVESHFGRGTFRLNKAMVLELATGMNAVSTHLYSRVKQIDVESWVMPSSAIETKDHFWYLYKVMANNL